MERVSLSLSEVGRVKVLENAKALMDELSNGQHEHRAAVTFALMQGLSYDDAQEMGVSKAYLAKARGKHKQGGLSDSSLLKDKAVSAKRPRREHQVAHAQEFLRDETAVPQSGDKKEVFRSFISLSASWKEYLIACATSSEGIDPAGFKHFKRAWKSLGVRKSSHSAFDFFSCTICHGAKTHVFKLREQIAKLQAGGLPSNGEILSLFAKISLIEVHVLKFEQQRKVFLEQRDRLLRPGIGHLTADFGTFELQSGSGKMGDLVFVLATMTTEGEVLTRYIDCVPYLDSSESKDWCFVESVFRGLQRAGFFSGLEEILWWSDTGPNHFRVSNTLFFFRLFQIEMGIRMKIHFFAPYHGHSKCDGHIGAIVQKVRLRANSLADSGDTWDKAFVEQCIQELNFTFLTKHVIFRREPRVKTLEGIKKYLVFQFDTTDPGASDSVDCGEICGSKWERKFFSLMDPGAALPIETDQSDEQGQLDVGLALSVGMAIN